MEPQASEADLDEEAESEQPESAPTKPRPKGPKGVMGFYRVL